MNGSQAFKYLAKMTPEEREATQIVWLDGEMTENFMSDDADKRAEFFRNLPAADRAKLLYDATSSENGDFSPEFSAFLDGFSERLERAIGKMMGKEE